MIERPQSDWKLINQMVARRIKKFKRPAREGDSSVWLGGNGRARQWCLVDGHFSISAAGLEQRHFPQKQDDDRSRAEIGGPVKCRRARD